MNTATKPRNHCTRTYAPSSVQELIETIGAGNPDPTNNKEVITFVTLWDGRKITGSYYKGSNTPDINVPDSIICDEGILQPLVNKLLNEGAPIIITTGTSDNICTLIWQLVK